MLYPAELPGQGADYERETMNEESRIFQGLEDSTRIVIELSRLGDEEVGTATTEMVDIQGDSALVHPVDQLFAFNSH